MPEIKEVPNLIRHPLQEVCLFDGLAPGSLDSLAKRCGYRRYRPGQMIVRHLDRTGDVFFVLTGTVRVVLFSPAGKEVSFRDLGPGEFFGELAAIDGEVRSANVIAKSNTSLAVMSRETFRDVVRTHPGVAATLLKRLAGLVRLYSQRLYEVGTLGVRNRIHAELLRLANENMADDNAAIIAPIPTHAEIASRISTRREAVARELAALARSGLLQRDAGSLRVCDVERLRIMVAEVRGD